MVTRKTLHRLCEAAAKSNVLKLALVTMGCAACGSSMIPNTTVEENSENRSVIEFVEKYRLAVQRRDVAALLAMASHRYLDDNGTPSGHDDIDYQKLREKLTLFQKTVMDVRYEIRYRSVTYEGERVLVDYTYTGHYQLKMPDGGSRWSRRLADNRLILARTGNQFNIVSGM